MPVLKIADQINAQRASSLRWSAPPEEIASQLQIGQSVTFAVRYRQVVRWRQIDFVLTSLREATIMDGAFDPLGGAPRAGWLIWQSANGVGAVSALPCDAAALCERLSLSRSEPDAAPAVAALTAVVEAAYRQGGLLD